MRPGTSHFQKLRLGLTPYIRIYHWTNGIYQYVRLGLALLTRHKGEAFALLAIYEKTNFIAKSKEGPFGEKNLKKNRFLCLITQKNRLKKCRLIVKFVFENQAKNL